MGGLLKTLVRVLRWTKSTCLAAKTQAIVSFVSPSADRLPAANNRHRHWKTAAKPVRRTEVAAVSAPEGMPVAETASITAEVAKPAAAETPAAEMAAAKVGSPTEVSSTAEMAATVAATSTMSERHCAARRDRRADRDGGSQRKYLSPHCSLPFCFYGRQRRIIR
jgi:hypothetical protein